METNYPFFSIIIPVYNPNVEYFRRCMESILQQTYSEYEIILSDDGSKQEYSELYDQYAEKNRRITVLHNQNQGVSVARNYGIKAARADWIMFVDADDWLERDALQDLSDYLKQVDCDILLFRAIKEFANHQSEMKYGFRPNTIYKMSDLSTKERLYKRAMSTPNAEAEDYCVIYYSWDKVYSRRFLTENELIYPVGITNSEDKVFILRCFEKMKSLYVVDDQLYHYRINDESASKKYTEKADFQRTSLAKLLEEIARRMDAELGALSGRPEYHKIYDEYMRFCFGIISDVFNYKFFHPGFPRDKKSRDKEVKAFLNTYPFDKAIRYVHYSELSNVARIKKLLLTLKMPALFYRLKRKRMKKAGEIPMSGNNM